jgi:DNA-binding transcriptional regulator/RsmH inhibitor MraZ
LLLHGPEGWQELVNRIGKAVPGSRAHRALCRRFLGHSEMVVPDGNRRIRLPEPLMSYAGIAIGQPVVLVGMGKVVEIWSAANLGTTLAEATAEEEALFASLIEPTKAPATAGVS